MPATTLDAGEALHLSSAALMKLVNIHHELDWRDFDVVVQFLEKNLDNVITEVHSFGKLLIDDGETQLNCPPAPEPGDSHGSLLLRTLSERNGPDGGILARREFKVHDCGINSNYAATENGSHHWVEIREDIMKAPSEPDQPPFLSEKTATVSIRRGIAAK